MSSSIHGHVILERIIEAGGKMPLAELRAFAESSHGRDARYFTCSASGMSFDSLCEFLSMRNKVQIEDGMVQVFAQNMCNHGSEEEHSH